MIKLKVIAGYAFLSRDCAVTLSAAFVPDWSALGTPAITHASSPSFTLAIRTKRKTKLRITKRALFVY